MIEKTYAQTYNARTPGNYFERYLATFWRKNFYPRPGVPQSEYFDKLSIDLTKYGATFTHDDLESLTVTWRDDRDFINFMMKYS